MLASHPLDCAVCDKAGECVLQDLAYKYGSTKGRFKSLRNNAPQHENPLVDTNTNRCILCGKCVRICWEQQGVGALNFQNRGASTIVATAFNETLNCEFCGSVYGCLSRRRPHSQALQAPLGVSGLWRPAMPFAPSAVWAAPSRSGHPRPDHHRSRGRYPHGVNRGTSVQRAAMAMTLCTPDDRLTTPSYPARGNASTASWEEALDHIAESLRWIKEKKGAERIGAIGSPRFQQRRQLHAPEIHAPGDGKP